MFGPITRWFSRNGLGLTLFGLILALIFAWLTPTIFIFIPPGHVGVYWIRFGSGTVLDRVLSEGVAYKYPWDKIYIYDARMQIANDTFDSLTTDGLSVAIDMSIRYRLIRQDIPLLQKNIGPDYLNTLLLPEINSWAREQISKYTPEELYSKKRSEIEDAIAQDMKHAMRFEYQPQVDRESFLFIEDVLIKSIRLPDKVAQAIEDKRLQYHLMEGYSFRIEREEKERLRKQIEARGIRDFQSIVSAGISEQYLKWKGITATLQLATSKNAKVVVIGAGEGGLPIILGNLDRPATAASEDTTSGDDDAAIDQSSSPTTGVLDLLPSIDSELSDMSTADHGMLDSEILPPSDGASKIRANP
jgi:regulator of protease activity HflC (stomatin/prohibitin superfamily)